MKPRLFKHANGYWYVETERNKRKSLQTKDEQIAKNLYESIKLKCIESKLSLVEREFFEEKGLTLNANDNNLFISCGFIYFIQAGDNGPIKIGYATDAQLRINRLQHFSPIELKVLAIINGCIRIEKMIHRKFNFYRKHGEWFAPEQELLSFIDAMNADGLNPGYAINDTPLTTTKYPP